MSALLFRLLRDAVFVAIFPALFAWVSLQVLTGYDAETAQPWHDFWRTR